MKRAYRYIFSCSFLLALFLSGCVTTPEATLSMNLVGPDASEEVQQRHAVHYLFAHRMLPGIVKNNPEDIARGLASWPEIYLRRIWFDLEDINADYVNAHVDDIRAQAFDGPTEDSRIYVIDLPAPEYTPQAYRVAVVVPSVAGRPSYYTLEKSFLIEETTGADNLKLQLAFFGAWDGLMHYNLGMYGVLENADFAQLVRESLEAPFEEQIENTQTVEIDSEASSQPETQPAS